MILDSHASTSPIDLVEAFRNFILQPDFPCVAAKAALHGGVCKIAVYNELASPPATLALGKDLHDFITSQAVAPSDYATFAAIFRGPLDLDEVAFEGLLWAQLRDLHREDVTHCDWDTAVSSDPDSALFGFSYGEHAFFIVGLHGQASRQARRFAWPVLVFNFHEQFERLRVGGKWKRMQDTIRARDVELQGSMNPMISDYGASSEARQYSGRAVEEEWRAPFPPGTQATGGCPFPHP